MKKLTLALIALIAVLMFSAPVKAQFYGNEACNNTSLSNWGTLDAQQGSGPNGEKVVRFYIAFHYNAKDPDGVRRELPTTMVNVMNEYAKSQGYKSRFIATDYNSPVNLNLTVYMDIYSGSGDTYQIFNYVNGWGVGHLFQFRTASEETADAFIESATGVTQRIGTGWTCGTQK